MDSPFGVCVFEKMFEESGVLFAYREDGSDFNPNDEESDLLNILRDNLNNGKIGFADVLREFNLKLAVDKLIYLSHWITPKMETRRYSTRFFVASIADDQKAIHDGHEAVDSLWVKIEQGLEEYNQGNFPIIMPTIKNLELVSG
ncbi:MAG: hypothetical protein Ct9H300mP6_12540 [Gammaproteobacteria bacterium]|nr:MAG: hypothetical protein Ct9H300mP6_12540 [Gammaproteobacteria bacterium]